MEKTIVIFLTSAQSNSFSHATITVDPNDAKKSSSVPHVLSLETFHLMLVDN